MTRIGITGHSNLSADSAELVRKALVDALEDYTEGGLVGISCLARGADQLFAEEVLDLGGQLEVVLPSADYREAKVGPEARGGFDRLLVRAHHVRYMSLTAGRQAYEEANEAVLGGVDLLFAVWDGQPSGGGGGTADAVRLATERGIPVNVIWPEGARRG
ncbi:hypothetical protein OUQ99_21190 [Streptomonospora nanhaiensis]|uniref:DNA recombination-mediator protein A n=1 Tax=Streptomonospora nanhaiensis TaxID=1323731 RepID=A0ABY6YHW7_9ACTN|nr:hypothetical protein [Streptomonospora nanhaiensis]WAE71736.1 hypothetical protein OUQ99_21190 [Streptomonospora nanhaiensis]